MTRLRRLTLAGSLVTAPILLAAGEAARMRVEQGRTDSADAVANAGEKITQVAAHLATWHMHGYLVLAGALTWLGAVIALTALISERRPTLGLVGGVLGLSAGLGWAVHLGFYTVQLSVSAAVADTNPDAAATVWAAGDSSSLLMAMVLFFIATNLLAHLVFGFGLWRAQVLPWWAAVWLPALPVLLLDPGSNPAWAAAFLVLLIPFVLAARRLLTSGVVDQRLERVVVDGADDHEHLKH